MQFDYLTLSIKFAKGVPYEKQFSTILDTLHLSDLWNEFAFIGRSKFYAGIYQYNNVTVSVPAVYRAEKQGFCVAFSSAGLAFYHEHLKSIDDKLDLRKILQAWRALGFAGEAFPRCTRCDICHDDKAEGANKPLLTMNKIRNAYKRGEIRSRFRRPKGNGSKTLDISDDWSGSRSGDTDTGSTIYFGNRKSAICCRFYDKLAEQKKAGAVLPSALSSWVRCEFEFKDTRAMSVVNYYMDNSDKDFSEYMAGVFNNYLSFIVLDDVNRSRCSLKRWWYKFIGTVERAPLTLPEYKNATFAGTSQWLNKLAPTLYAYIECVGLRRALKLLEKYGKDPDKKTARIKQMQNDYIFTANTGFTDKVAKPLVSLGLDPWIMTNKDKDLDRLMYRIEKEYKRFHSENGVNWDPYRENKAGEWVAPWKREKVSAPAVHQLDLFNVSDYAEFWQ